MRKSTQTHSQPVFKRGTKRVLNLAVSLLLAAVFLQSCSGTDLLPVGTGTDQSVAIPRVILNCQSTQCRTNATSPLIAVMITTSPCTLPSYGAIASSSTQSISCTSLVGCYGEISGWTGSTKTLSTIPSGTYNICACIDYSGTHIPWTNCNTLGQKTNVPVTSTSGLQTVTSWTDQ